jgi:serine/threonine-protein kinase RsbW
MPMEEEHNVSQSSATDRAVSGPPPRTALLRMALTSEPTCVRQAAEALRKELLARGCDAELLGELELCTVEAMNNVLEHGYDSRAGQPFELSLWLEGEAIVLELRDEGRPLPQELLAHASLPRIDPSHIPGLPEGGWGLGILHALLDEVSYEACSGHNLLRLVRKRPLTGSSSSPP